jgi:hypothetical protein
MAEEERLSWPGEAEEEDHLAAMARLEEVSVMGIDGVLRAIGVRSGLGGGELREGSGRCGPGAES